VDRQALPGHLYKADYDPEGLLSTLPALATTLIGVLAGHWLRSKRDGYEKDAGLFFAGSVGVALGWAWSATFPINKALWTSSFVLLTAGLGLQLFAACYWLVDLRLIRRWAAPL
jgi:predicted acyltransferase